MLHLLRSYLSRIRNYHYHLHTCENYSPISNQSANDVMPIDESDIAEREILVDSNPVDVFVESVCHPSYSSTPPQPSMMFSGCSITDSLASLYIKIHAENHTAHTTIDSINRHILSMIWNMSHDDLDRCKGNKSFLKQLRSQAGRTRYYSKQFGLIEPIEIAVGSTLDTNFELPETKQNTNMYIPIKRTLSALFSYE